MRYASSSFFKGLAKLVAPKKPEVGRLLAFPLPHFALQMTCKMGKSGSQKWWAVEMLG
jgi:hypothetical protein